MYYWFFMFLAIITEVVGTLTMKYGSETDSYLSLAIMLVMITASYWFLSIAIRKIPLAVAYGTWVSIGLILIDSLHQLFSLRRKPGHTHNTGFSTGHIGHCPDGAQYNIA